jgi:competence protein ComEA
VDPTTTPWRALEDAPEPAAGAADTAPPRGFPRSAILGGGAVLLAIAAFFLAFSSSAGGTVSVDAATPLAVDSSRAGAGAAPSDGPFSAGGGPILVVEIGGAVARPGVYRLAQGARIGDLIDAAGGYGPRVDAERTGRELNLAAPLHDGDQVRVPSRDDPTAGSAPPVPGAGSKGGGPAPVDLNRATATELDALPGIGPVTAAKIIASRDEQPFGTVEDLRTRKLVGEKTFASLKDLVAVY